jgi:hypothetical protein
MPQNETLQRSAVSQYRHRYDRLGHGEIKGWWRHDRADRNEHPGITGRGGAWLGIAQARALVSEVRWSANLSDP